ncbi:hypothetical protein C5L31_000889 [Secundilactobacillus malefermentans]|uniref:Methyl-accepting chemotaxis-like protein n=1 Tax=Secundilactobacillus malefermentans TaxID=176292 RepID=A0A4R5NID9_9LACO|nr:methyl-accepting chemotaxis-like protein [Secundilactobacillus malefermentans DSM 5705 = KCTC 3548]TDG74322.1 hypothetical protein C5L31_000889 [Secundilactobacillus malefermentans]
MTGGQVAGLIAAVAFLILVIFIGIFLMRMTKTLGEVNKSVKTLTGDVDVLSHQAENLMANANELLEDVGEKSVKVDPVFQAAGDLGQSVSDLNEATRKLTDRVSGSHKGNRGNSLLTKIGATAFGLYLNRHKKQN